MVRNFIPGDVPVGDEGVVGVIQGGEVCHLRWAAVRVFPLGKKLVDGVDSVGLDGVIGGEYDEHWHVRL